MPPENAPTPPFIVSIEGMARGTSGYIFSAVIDTLEEEGVHDILRAYYHLDSHKFS